MAVDSAALKAFVNASDKHQELLDNVSVMAPTLVAAYIEGATVPQTILEHAEMLVAAELFHATRAPNGVLNQQFASEDGTQAVPVRVSGDPLRPARPLLAPWVLPVVGTA
jgi:hypothetical protein